MRVDVEAAAAMSAGLDRIRARAGDPRSVPGRGAGRCRRRHQADRSAPEHRDRTDRRFVTLDPATSVDLDQAFDIEQSRVPTPAALRDRRRRMVRATRRPARRRGVQPRRHRVPPRSARRRSIPTALSEGAASLLPERRSPGRRLHRPRRHRRHLPSRRRASGRSCAARAKLAYDTVTDADLPARVSPNCIAGSRPPNSGATRRRFEFPEQQIARDDDGHYTLRFRPRPTPRSRTRRSRWRPTSPSPMRCWRPTPACSV